MIVSSITVVDLPQAHGRPFRARVAGGTGRHPARVAAGAAAGLAALATILVIALGSETPGPAGDGRAQPVPPGERAAIAAALGYPYPAHCLVIGVSGRAPDYATVHIDRTGGCANYSGYINASLHRAGGTWRLLLDEGQLFVPNRLLGPSTAGSGSVGYPIGCLSPATLRQLPGFARGGFDRGICAHG